MVIVLQSFTPIACDQQKEGRTRDGPEDKNARISSSDKPSTNPYGSVGPANAAEKPATPSKPRPSAQRASGSPSQGNASQISYKTSRTILRLAGCDITLFSDAIEEIFVACMKHSGACIFRKSKMMPLQSHCHSRVTEQ
jgi:hypothetical protein